MEKLPVITKFCGESIGPDNVRTVYSGEEDFTQTNLEQKNILLFGSHESGKNEIIDAFCNIIYGINFDSLIRYKIANERFDDSKDNNNSIVKYVFYGTKFQFIPVIIDIPDIGNNPNGPNQPDAFSLLQTFVNYDYTTQIHTLVITLPANIPSFSPAIEKQFSKILSLFSPKLKETTISITNYIESETNSSNLLLQQIGILPFKKFYTNTNSLFSKPSLDANIREKQMREFDLTVQNLTIFILNLGRSVPQAISSQAILAQQQQQRPISATPPRPSVGLPPRPRPTSAAAQNRPMTIPSTIHEVKEDISISSNPTTTYSISENIPVIQLRTKKFERPFVENFSRKIIQQQQPRPSSFQETEDRIQIVKSSKITKDIYSSEQALAPPSKFVIYGSQPIGPEVIPVGDTLYPVEDGSGYIQVKRYLYDPTTRTYQMYYVRERCPTATSGSSSQTFLPPTISSSSPIPRIVSPAHGIRKSGGGGDVRQEMARLIRRGSVEDIEATPTESSEQSSGYIQRGGMESARSTASEWKYTPSNKGTLQHAATTYISGSPEPPLIKLSLPEQDVKQVSGYSYADPRMSWRQNQQQQAPPPKPARAIDPEFGNPEEDDEEKFQRAIPMRQTKRLLTNSQRRAIKSHPQQGLQQLQQQRQQQYSGYPEFDTADEIEYAENVPLRKYQPNQEIYQQKVPIKQGWGSQTNTKRFSYPPQNQQQQQPQPRNPYTSQIPNMRPNNPRNARNLRSSQGPPGRRRRQKQITFEIEEEEPTSERSRFDCTKCCFYILAPIFIISAIIAVVVTLILSAR